MSLLKNKPKRESEIPTASLADIAFLILIFFLVSTTIDMDKGISLILPAIGGELEVHKRNITNVMVDPLGKVLLDNEEVEISEISKIAERLLLENPKMIFSVKTHPRTPYQKYIEVLDQLKQANATRISIAE